MDSKVEIEYSDSQNETLKSTSNLLFQTVDMNNKDNIFTLAEAFLCITSMTHKKLQKLCYYAKAWYLALNDKNLIPEQFQAWIHGAVQPGLYQIYKEYGSEDIPKSNTNIKISEEINSFAKEIYDAYGHLTGNELEQLNHTEEPWIKARGNCKPWERCDNIITEDSMKIFYRSMIKG